MLRFWLNKWYFDCTTADGAMAIGYAAMLKYGPVRIKYGAILIKECNDGSLLQRQSFSFGNIKKHQDLIEWRSQALAIEGALERWNRFRRGYHIRWRKRSDPMGMPDV